MIEPWKPALELVQSFLIWAYPYTKSLHIISVIAWMAALFYLPRLFVYHAEQSDPGDALDDVFQVMERRLLKAIMTPAMVATWLFGLALVATPAIVDWSSVWPYTKLGGILGLTCFHHWLAMRRRDFADGANAVTGRTYRIMNEVPTVLLIIIVFSVVVRF
ncbi:protoporphyrinogen oxidase HemJ [Roseovarius sp. SCSIO 43702]|uniref:protoporphyrinogen oxidase HemJ n=1 Tax=Roseovarius sp. SCSIO 43702 TaxID=2823043 RepID=UPI001C72B587|nr:protoporphyrinogen oxidase HemJ [Roseovarius sp. SCSIO 43702]QYX56992.1 protoporphyrinogen oxidase HemJ [Roseovarius sp. SCSIO 43702]